MSKKVYKINERNISQYRTNQKDEIFEGAKLLKTGFPSFWPTRDENNALVFISFVNCQIFDREGNLVDDTIANFNILDEETFDPNDKNAVEKVRFISALLSPKYLVKGGVYISGKYYTGQMKYKYAQKLYKAFMSKYFYVEDSESINKYFDKNEEGYFPYWPTKSRTGKKVVFSAVHGNIMNISTNAFKAEDVNFDIFRGKDFDLKDSKDKNTANTVFDIFDKNSQVTGCYYKGTLLPKKLTKKFKLYLEKTFIKKNFSINQVEYLSKHATRTEDHRMRYFPMHDDKHRPVAISFRNGVTPFGEEYANFDIYADEEFNLTIVRNRNIVNIIENIIGNNPEFKGSLYLDGVLISKHISKAEIEHRVIKTEKALRVRLYGDPDYLKIISLFTTEDREKLLMLSKKYENAYPNKNLGKSLIDNEAKVQPYFVFDRVNILDEAGNWLFKECYSASYNEPFTPNETEITILKEAFKQSSYVRGGLFLNGKNINHRLHHSYCFHPVIYNKFIKELKKNVKEFDFNEMMKNRKEIGVPYKMDKKSKMPIHWPTFDKTGREVLLSTVDSNVWFKVGRNIVKAANDMNFNIFSGETFGLVGESGSGKTTISRAILGINPLAKGGIYWKGKLISSGLNRKEQKMTKKSIQMIFQDPAACLNERANIDYIVSEGLYNFKMFTTKEERLSKVVNMLGNVGLLPEHLSRYPHEFSGGQRQRIGIARALVIEPELVLADEPISALDVSIRAQVLNLLKRLQKEQNLTYLFIAHDLSIIRYISDRIAVMHNGYIVELGVAEEIYQNPLHPYTKSLLTAIPQPDPITKDKRKRISYEQGDVVYGKCHWEEFGKGHYVLVNDELKEKIKAHLKKQKAK